MNEHDRFHTKHNRFQAEDPPITVNQVRAGRAIAQLGIRELARASGLSITAISHIETGRTRKPHLATLLALRAALTVRGVDFARGGWTRHIADAHEGQCPPPGFAHSSQVGHTDNDGLDADTDDNDGPGADDANDDTDDAADDDEYGEPNGPDWRELNQWLATAWED